ncbi:hypothetical protein GOBAR_DD15970 [Gossypium barbadense]|nr:hypothetical protein GOBAR_DD15970 [Gossypium barbadense]
MGESGGDDKEQRDEISLLTEELIQLSVKGLKVVPNEKPTLICTIWTKKFYNPESFRTQIKSLWKTKKKFEIQIARQNLFLIAFEMEEDLELIMEGRPWLFRKSLILFDRITQLVERSQIQLNSSPVWLKVGPRLTKFDKKDLLHAIGVTFGGIIRSKINGEWCHLKINLDVQKPLRKGGSELELIEDEIAREANNWVGMTHGELQQKDENCNKKRKATKGILETCYIEVEYGDRTKRLKKDREKEQGETLLEKDGKPYATE